MIPPPKSEQLIDLSGEEKPILTVVVDTEEQFDWSQPFSRGNVGVSAMAHIHRFQSICDEFRVKPCYVVDYPVVNQVTGFEPLKTIHERNGCSIGAHVHPWVNPPHEEEPIPANSYPGNLPMLLEKSKLAALNEKISSVFGSHATIYKAGRYGLGPNTYNILEELDFEVDVSTMPAFDLSSDGGPNYEAFPAHPWWFGKERRLLCIPATAALVGFLGPCARPVYRLATRPGLQRLHAPGILARLRLADRLRLSPEGYTLSELKRLTHYCLNRRIRLFSLSFHSPSLMPGCTPYVRTEHDLEEFLDTLRRYFEFFFEALQGRAMGPLEVRDRFLAAGAGART